MFRHKNNSSGFALFEIVAIVAIMGLVFAFGTPKYLECIRNVHNSNINIMVGTIRIWSANQAVNNFTNTGSINYPLPKSTTIDNVIAEGKLIKWNDTDPSHWIYVAGGGINISGDGSYLEVKPIYIN